MIQTRQEPSLAEALKAAADTRALEIGPDLLKNAPQFFHRSFGQHPAIIVADANTFAVAGQKAFDTFRHAGHPCLDPFVYSDPSLYAEHKYLIELEEELKFHEAIPIAVGAGTINDLTKLAAHRLNRPYLCIPTAASMDGYTAFGASITYNGSKQTFSCPAPAAVLADLDVICAAPTQMNAWGFADLLAKVTAGADWILADALGVEPIHPQAWRIAQDRLREFVADPAGVRAANPTTIALLVEGLMLGGFAMQTAKSSRAASGAEHQFSHLWDMQHHTHDGKPPSHGFKVGIGSLAVTALYEYLLAQPVEELNVDDCCARYLNETESEKMIRSLFVQPELLSVALNETRAKSLEPAQLRAQLQKLRSMWPSLRERLRKQLLPLPQIKSMLITVGAPVEPEQIGISRERLRKSFLQAFFIRRRFTVLDVAVRTGFLESALNQLFGPNGPWPIYETQTSREPAALH
jgi:glycerol-1-phosphate dehydrogenase [NAD(P)+]